ncbi:uncharacterized protein LOC130590681 [Beta vulgaris subsp. vulgaris]|uniref:uncharacterized protein LOC130590681 n=1 Tax=Beta vulgaris subsp. vulgaris TaxID=3555 RepID=UPI002547A3E4|nr:uncharacterized protein LOC130590681 [Beta vulgaris subsp. vulgaris]
MRDHRSYKEVSTHSHPYQNTSHPKPPTPKPSPTNTIQPNQLFEPIPEHFEKEISKLREESSKLLGQDTVKTRDQITLEDFDGEQLIAIKGKVSQENEELFSRSAIGIANSSSTSEVIHEHILAEGVNCLRVKPLGGMAHLIIFDSIEDKEAMIGSQWLLRWFNNIQNVHGDCTTQWRQAWITIYGVPLSAWSYENFFQIGNIYGRVLSAEYSRMDYAKVLIFTDCFFQINNPLIFTLEERKFKVFITEECTSYGCSKPITPAETSKAKMDHDGDKDASDISPFSEEDEQLDGSPIVNHFSSSENELESKLEALTPKMVKSMWNWDDVEFCLSPSEGNSGGLISLWRSSQFQMWSFHTDRNWISISGILISDDFPCTLVNVYNSCDGIVRAGTWRDIVEFCSSSQYPCLIAGDFNEILSEKDRGSQLIDLSNSARFNDFITDLHLIEITPSEGWFTWFRGTSMSKLDRFFVQAEWITKFPLINTSILKRTISDHCPLIIKSMNIDWGPRPFRFQDVWLSHPGCLETIKNTWCKSEGMSLMGKLKCVKADLKLWNLQCFGNIDTKISSLETEIQEWDDLANSRTLNEEEAKMRSSVQAELWSWLKKKEIFWAQNSRVQWLKHGDKNTKFFHTLASIRKNRNSISSLEIGGSKLETPDEIRSAALEYFTNLFKEESFQRPIFQGLDFMKLSDQQAADLIEPISNQEIDNAVASCNPSKSPGPDGFNFRFIKSSWEIIKEDVYSIIQEFWLTGNLPKGSNVAFIALIAKTENPRGFKEYRPISMVGCIYKIIAKILAHRLKRVMNHLVGPHQSSFIEGRNILDSVLIAGELLESCRSSKLPAVLLKLDFHKAFDCVSWSFLYWTLEQMGFPPQWILWISSCVSSATASILLNGTPTKPFKLQRGLRQGDPLSPFLFILVVEVLNLLIKKATAMGFWSGIEVCKYGPVLSHLQFADDTVLFSSPDPQCLHNVRKVLILFQLASGLQINFHKSELLGVNVNESEMQELAHLLGCKVGSFPLIYLGLPIGGNMSRMAAWDLLIEKMKLKLAGWKSNLLSIGGRLTLLRASLANLPVYFMSLYPIPQGVIQKIIGIQRRFLWNGGLDKKAMALIKWECIQLPKMMGGLNVCNLYLQNLGLLFKWIWRFFLEPNSLWRQTIQAKYHYSSSFRMGDLNHLSKGGPWRGICNRILNHQGARELLEFGSRRKIGNGEDTLFWHDSWLTEVATKHRFPRLYRIVVFPLASVASMGTWANLNWEWNIAWKRAFRPRDQAEWNDLSLLLQGTILSKDKKDQWLWLPNNSGPYSVKSVYLELQKNSEPLLREVSHKLWKGLVPFRIEVFLWLVLLERINTKMKLATHNIIPMSDASCSFCRENPEDVTHLFLLCPFAQSIWNWWCSLWNLSWVWPRSVKMAFEQWIYPSKNKFFRKVWLASFQVILWSLWKERNARVFSNSFSSSQEVQILILLRLCWWIKGWKDSFPYSPEEVIRNPECLQWKEPPPNHTCSFSLLKDSSNWPKLQWIVEVSWIPSQNRSVIGGALLNRKKEILCLFSSPIPPMDSNSAEVIAIHRATQISINSELYKNQPTELFSKSLMAVKWCSSTTGGSPNLSLMLNFIRSASARGLNLSISHKAQSSLSVKDLIANHGYFRNSEFVIWKQTSV